MSLERVYGLVHGKGNAGFRALYDKAGLPASTYPAFREAIEAMHEDVLLGETGDASRLKRRMVERVLTRCARSIARRHRTADDCCCAASPPKPRAKKRACSADELVDMPDPQPPADYDFVLGERLVAA